MPYPLGMTVATITVGVPVGFDWVDDIATSVKVEPTVALVWAATGTPVLDFPITRVAGPGMPLQFDVPHVDQPGFIDNAGDAFTMWAYRCSITWTDASSKAKKTAVKNIQPLAGQTLIDLDLVPGGTIQLGVSAPIPDVLSVAGLTGAISAAALSTALGGADLTTELDAFNTELGY